MTRAELDTHADTCCLGYQCHVLAQHDTEVTLVPFEKSLGTMQNVPIVDAAIAFDDPRSNQTQLLILHQVLYVPSMPQHLLCPMQL